MLPSDIPPTRSAVLQLREERSVINETYDFLDEKRLLLAAEILRQLKVYEDLLRQISELRHDAEIALLKTMQYHGLHGTQVYPGTFLDESTLENSYSKFMGVTLCDTALLLPDKISASQICNPSFQANDCREKFLQLTKLSIKMAGTSGNLHRLLTEYKKTERRARALENVIIPEVEQSLQQITTSLDEMDQEDVVRIHLHYDSDGLSE